MTFTTTHEPVALILERGVPARFVFAGQRWRVTGTPLVTEIEPCPPQLTHGEPIITGFQVTAQTEQADDVATFALRRLFPGWEIEGVSY